MTKLGTALKADQLLPASLHRLLHGAVSFALVRYMLEHTVAFTKRRDRNDRSSSSSVFQDSSPGARAADMRSFDQVRKRKRFSC